ncbi:MAG: sulfatase-like hydrolase/transferase [Verrucomicrobiae bacterium]
MIQPFVILAAAISAGFGTGAMAQADVGPGRQCQDFMNNSKLTLMLMLAVFWAGGITPVQAKEKIMKPDKPNLVFFLADDLRAGCLGVLGNSVVKTPNLDKLLENGLSFCDAYTLGSHTPAVCLPARSMIMTGQSYLHMVSKMGPHLGLINPSQVGTPTLVQTMKAAGYASIRSGKMDNTPMKLEDEFDQNLDGKNAAGNADNLIRFIEEHAGKKPLFLYMASKEPHDPPFSTEEFKAMYKPEAMPVPDSFLPIHPFDNGAMNTRDEVLQKELPVPRTRESIARRLAIYYASVSYWDAQVGRVIEALKKAGQFDSTIFVVAGDNGLSLGDHGLVGKQNLYEFGGMHVPLVFAGPGIVKGESKALVYLYEVYPSLCELAGIPVPAGLDARSLAPILRGRQSKVRDCLFTAYEFSQRAIRDDRWKLIRYPLIDKTQLFDLQADPHEMADLAGKPEYAGKIEELMELMEKTRKEYGDKAPLKVSTASNPKSVPPVNKEQVRSPFSGLSD